MFGCDLEDNIVAESGLGMLINIGIEKMFLIICIIFVDLFNEVVLVYVLVLS